MRQEHPENRAHDRRGEGRTDKNSTSRPPPALRQLFSGRLRELSLSTLERCGRRGLELREGLEEPGRDQLIEMLRLVKVLQLVLAQVTQRDVRDRILAKQLAGGLGDKYLAPVTGSADPGRAMHAKADISLAAHSRLARVNAHPDAKLRAVRPSVRAEAALARDCSRYRVLGASEGDEE